MEWLLGIDTRILYFINGLNTPFLDEVMWVISKPMLSIPIYLFFIYLFYTLDGKNFWKPLLAVILVVTLADRISVECFKDVVCRLRPSHTEGILENLHFYVKSNGKAYQGGLYGFVSSHAANTFGVAVFMMLYAKRKYVTAIALVWASVVSLSRVYLGVHFPPDILAGGALGALLGWFVFLGYKKLSKKYGWVN
mgnify:CR=1 FL=1